MKKHLANVGIALLVLVVIGGAIAITIGSTSRANTNENTYVNVYIEDGYRDRYNALRDDCRWGGHFVLGDMAQTFFVINHFQILEVSDNIVLELSYFNFYEHIVYLWHTTGFYIYVWFTFDQWGHEHGFTHANVCCCQGGHEFTVTRV